MSAENGDLTGTLQGGEKYQQAFYVFEELAQAPATSSVRSLVAQAVAELHLGRLEEAESALDQAVKTEPQCADAIANALVLSVISGDDTDKLTEYVPSYIRFLDLAVKPGALRIVANV